MPKLSAVLREHNLSIFQAGVAAANPQQAINHCLSVLDGQLRIRLNLLDDSPIRSGRWSKIHLMAVGKAACAMASAARQALPQTWCADPGIVITNYENVVAVEGFEVLGAGHPLPDNKGLLAAQRLVSRIKNAQANELILLLLSGGGSALLPYPVEGVSLADKIATTRLLLSSGATINQINGVRKHLSQIKGGGLARWAPPADLHALILSDVLGDDLSAIASGPTVADETRFADAIGVFNDKQLWPQVPEAVRDYLQQGAAGLKAETLKPGDPALQSAGQTLIGSNAISVEAAISAAQQNDYQTHLYSRHLCGEAREVAEQLARHAQNLLSAGLQQATAVIAGGETTVTLRGSGKGGRNQEMALAFAMAAEQLALACEWVFLSGGTDGLDGPTDAAGGIVDNTTLNRIRHAGINPQTALAHNDSYPALQAANDLLITGATGTNVADLQILLLHPAHA